MLSLEIGAKELALELRQKGLAIIGLSEQAQKIRAFAHKAAQTEHTVLLRGDTGVGKDHLAEVIHDLSRRDSFITVDCGLLPDGLMEAELFGHVRGAFSGAANGKIGLIELASGGTLFINEVTNLPFAMQSKLLRVMDCKSFRQIGGTREIDINTKIIVGTNANLEREMEQKRLRQDLYYRLNVLSFTLPPLAQRRDDIAVLAEHFLKKEKKGKKFSPEALACMENHRWPGNIRELKNIVAKAVFNLGDEEEIRPQHLELDVAGDESSGQESMPTFKEMERRYYSRLIRSVGGNLKKASRISGVYRGTIQKRVSQLNLEDILTEARAGNRN